jgi:hypothetical protein
MKAGLASHLELVLQEVLLVGQLSVEAEELRLLRGQLLCHHVRDCDIQRFAAGRAAAAAAAPIVGAGRKG